MKRVTWAKMKDSPRPAPPEPLAGRLNALAADQMKGDRR